MNGASDLQQKKSIFRTKKGVRIAVFSLVFFLLLFGGSLFFLIKFVFPSHLPEKNPATEENKLPAPLQTQEEMRGVYIASVLNLNFPSKPGLGEEALKAEIDGILEECASVGLNTVYFQVRPTGDALYKSNIFPTSRYLVETEGDPLSFDVFDYFIKGAKNKGIDTVAWVNPYRITNFVSENQTQALASLSENNPAKLHPEWTVFYAGKLYYDPALPEVRDLIASGVEEICRNYDVLGVLFDDYFYPYPVEGEVFHDNASFQKYANGSSKENWRRENVNALVKKCYEVVKSVREELTFGVSPFGIWKNSSTDPKGSDTGGLEAYSSVFCDALAWIQGGYVDYISPQIYWERGDPAADFLTLSRWWSAQVDGTGVKLYISHAAYKAELFALGGEEIVQQIRIARTLMASHGNIQYGFADIKQNTAQIKSLLTRLYADPYREELPETFPDGICFTRPENEAQTTAASHFVLASSDPRYPVYSSSGKIGRTKHGFFSVLMELSVGKNTLELRHKGKTYTLTVIRTDPEKEETPFSIREITPGKEEEVFVLSGTALPVSVLAPKDASVSVFLGDQQFSLTADSENASEETMVLYQGEIPFSAVFAGEEPVFVGTLEYQVRQGEKKIKTSGASCSVLPSSCFVVAEVQEDHTPLKRSPTSSFYEDYTLAAKGMRDRVTACYDGYYRLSCGAFVPKESVSVNTEERKELSVVRNFQWELQDETISLLIDSPSFAPVFIEVKEGQVIVTLHGTALMRSFLPEHQSASLLFSKTSCTYSIPDRATRLCFTLHSEEHLFGYGYSYEEGAVRIWFLLPQALEKGEKPLSGKRIALDAGHGGEDLGALGFLSQMHEKDLNLMIALTLERALERLGAEVEMTRREDETVSLTDRMDFLQENEFDFSISIHHNSVHESRDANLAAGTLGLYWQMTGRSLCQAVESAVQEALFLPDRGIRAQKLALCRGHAFPQMLLETSFICSPTEYEMAMSSDYTEKVSFAICEGILSWYEMQEEIIAKKGDVK